MISTSAIVPADSTSYRGVRAGDILPEMKQSAELDLQIRPSEGSRRLSLVCFWAAYDADSRATNVALDRYFSATVSDKIAYTAICLDPSEAVYSQTIERDRLDRSSQYCASESRQRLIEQYQLTNDLHTYLIDEDGVVLSVDPSIDELNKFYLL